MGIIFLHQLHDHLKSLRFQVSLLLLLLLFGLNGLIFTWSKQQQITDDATIVSANNRIYEQAKTISQAVQEYRIFSNRAGIEFIVEGGTSWLHDGMWFHLGIEEEPPNSGRFRSDNNWMIRFEEADWALIVRIVLSFVCIALAYNTVSSEIEQNTLSLVFSNPLSRGRYLMGKFLAHLTVLLVSIILCSLVSLLILSLNRAIELDFVIFRSYCLFLLGTLFYLSFFLLLSMGISALSRNSASSLVILIMLWALLIVIIPQTSYMISTQLIETPGAWWETYFDPFNDARETLTVEGVSLRGKDLGGVDGYAIEKIYASRMNEIEKQQHQFHKNNIQKTIYQYQIAKAINVLSPGFAFQYSVESLLNTGEIRYQHLLKQGWNYLATLRDFLRARDAVDPDSPHLLFLADYMSNRELDANNIPRFKYQHPPLSESIAAGIIPLIVLILDTAIAFFFAFWCFNRAEIAG